MYFVSTLSTSHIIDFINIDHDNVKLMMNEVGIDEV